MKSRFAVSSLILGLSALMLGACATDDSHWVADIPKPPSAAAAPASTEPTPAPVAITAVPVVAKVDFAQSVKPFFADYCIRCHGPMRQSGRIRYDDKAAVMAHAGLITPGDPGNSALYEALAKPAGADDHMPPAIADQPDAGDIAMIKQWITEGANWPDGQ